MCVAGGVAVADGRFLGRGAGRFDHAVVAAGHRGFDGVSQGVEADLGQPVHGIRVAVGTVVIGRQSPVRRRPGFPGLSLRGAARGPRPPRGSRSTRLPAGQAARRATPDEVSTGAMRPARCTLRSPAFPRATGTVIRRPRGTCQGQRRHARKTNAAPARREGGMLDAGARKASIHAPLRAGNATAPKPRACWRDMPADRYSMRPAGGQGKRAPAGARHRLRGASAYFFFASRRNLA